MTEIKVVNNHAILAGDTQVAHEAETVKPAPVASVTVPGFWDAFPRLATAKWLTVRNDEEEGLIQQIQLEITNLGLILALFTTMFLPLYYDEASRISIGDGDGFSIDVTNGVLQPLVVDDQFIHEWMDITYCGALCCGALGTVAAVFLSLAVNECGTDTGAMALLHKVGILIHCPYYLFSLSVICFAGGVWFHFFLVPRTIAGIVIKLSVAVGSTWYLLSFMSYLVQGVYQAKWNEETYPPIVIAEDVLRAKVEQYLAKDCDMNDRSLKGFLKTLTYVTETGYRVPLDTVSRAQAVASYYNSLAERLKVPLSTLILLRDDIKAE